MTPTPTATASPSLPLPLPYISLSYTLVHRCRPRAVVDLLSSSSSSSSSSDHLLCPFPPKMFPFPVCSRGFHACNENTRGKARIHRKIRILRKHSSEKSPRTNPILSGEFSIRKLATFKVSCTSHPELITYSVTI